MPYEQEINDIRLELAQKQRAINIEEDTSGILFGFVPASADDFTEIDKLAAEHSITPVILLDCSQEKEQLAQILEKAVAKDYEVALAGLQIDESILQTADEMKDLLAQIDDTKSPAFLLRGNVNTEETRNLLNEHFSRCYRAFHPAGYGSCSCPCSVCRRSTGSKCTFSLYSWPTCGPADCRSPRSKESLQTGPPFRHRSACGFRFPEFSAPVQTALSE